MDKPVVFTQFGAIMNKAAYKLSHTDFNVNINLDFLRVST